MKYDFGVFGGDMRQVYIGDLLEAEGYRVLRYGLYREEGKAKEDAASSFFELLESSRMWLGPIPLSRDQKGICQRGEKEDLTMKALLRALEGGGALAAGCIPKDWKDRGLRLYDYMEDEVLTSFNSIATAEGAIARAITEGRGNLHGSRCLVTGFGLCAQALALRLAGMKARVTVCARREEARQAAETAGYESVSLEDMDEVLPDCSYIFNTVPALLFGREELGRLEEETVLIDIASAPGGVDYEWAGGLGVRAFLCPGLPGIYAPRASAQAMAKRILEVRARGVRAMGETNWGKPEVYAANIRESDEPCY